MFFKGVNCNRPIGRQDDILRWNSKVPYKIPELVNIKHLYDVSLLSHDVEVFEVIQGKKDGYARKPRKTCNIFLSNLFCYEEPSCSLAYFVSKFIYHMSHPFLCVKERKIFDLEYEHPCDSGKSHNDTGI